MCRELIDKVLNGGLDTDGHLMTLFALVLSLKAKTIIELGVRSGNSTIPLLMGASHTNGIVHSVDIDPPRFDCPENLKKHWVVYKSDAIDFLKSWDEPVDLIYVDDLHTYDHVKQELEIIDRLITPSGLVLLHDTMYYNTQPDYHSVMTSDKQWANGGPYRAVAELDDRWEYATIPICHGLTILRKCGNVKEV